MEHIRGDRAHLMLAAAVALALVSIAGAWFSELVLGYVPCKLCLWQRWPYYLGLPFGFGALALWRAQPGLARLLAAVFVLVFLVSVGLGVYHSGVEWKWWAGPSDCGGRIVEGPASVTDFRKMLSTTKVIRCDDAAVRVLGLSFAGWNAVVSLAVAVSALFALRQRQGSSSVSQ